MTGYIKEQHTAIFTCQAGCGKTHLVLESIEKEYNKHFGFIITIHPTLREIIKPIILKRGSKTMIMFGLQILKTSFTNGLKSCQNCYDSYKYYLSSMISSLIKTLIRGDSPYQNYLSQVGSRGNIYRCWHSLIQAYQKN